MAQPQTDEVEPVREPVLVEPIYDFYLLVLAKMLEKVDDTSSVGISFNVSGGLVYGQLITREVWEKLWVSQVSAASDFAGEVLSGVVQARDEDIDNDESVPIRFVHLKDATYVSGSTRYRLGLWRAPLAQISGWSNGTPND
ncbi:hypothetical protein [Streptomyces sp. NPDC047000]|uniref:hypothetical protein n=1 Tax=Streptomyces sp. NPDC047000 TaxID=3155474 RepID=UPI0033FD4F42